MSTAGAPGGEVITDRPERTVRLLAAHDVIAATSTRLGPGEAGPDLHVHETHADAFIVLEGRLTFTLGAEREELVAEAGTFVSVPPGVAHAFRNDGPGDVRFVNVHSPSAGFHRYLRGEAASFDQHPPPPDGGGPASAVAVAAL